MVTSGKQLTFFLFPILTVGILMMEKGYACPSGKFGSICQYLCHCKKDVCSEAGVCQECQLGWWGPACQYVDSLQASFQAPGWLKDADDNTCINDISVQLITIPITVIFTWARIVVKDKQLVRNFTITFNDATPCQNMQTFLKSDTTLDFYCSNNQQIQMVKLSGVGVSSLCSFYISGGRNVALKQYINITSTQTFKGVDPGYGDPGHVVDGNTSQVSGRPACTYSSNTDTLPVLDIFLSQTCLVTNITIYPVLELMRFFVGYSVDVWNENNQLVYQYTDTMRTSRSVHILTIPAKFTKRVSIRVKNTLSLCEVQIFGDTVCQQPFYGRECEKRCKCVENVCFASTGGCPKGCLGEQKDCKGGSSELDPKDDTSFMFSDECPEGYYGVNCSKLCPIDCEDSHCNPVTGKCNATVSGFPYLVKDVGITVATALIVFACCLLCCRPRQDQGLSNLCEYTLTTSTLEAGAEADVPEVGSKV